MNFFKLTLKSGLSGKRKKIVSENYKGSILFIFLKFVL